MVERKLVLGVGGWLEGAGEARGRAVLQRIDLIRVNDRILDAAGVVGPPELRSLDAIHLATARELGDELSALVTYDDRMAAAAREMGYKIVQPH